MIGNVWSIPNTRNKTGHPAIFPEQLVLNHILSWSNKEDLIYDPFMGSGTTAIVSHLQERNWIGSETNNNYVKITQNRLLNPHSRTPQKR